MKKSDQVAQATIRALPRTSWGRAEGLSSSRVRIMRIKRIIMIIMEIMMTMRIVTIIMRIMLIIMKMMSIIFFPTIKSNYLLFKLKSTMSLKYARQLSFMLYKV